MGANLRVSNGSRKRNSSKRKGQQTGPNIQFESPSAIARIFGQNVSMNESKSEAMHDSFQVFSERMQMPFSNNDYSCEHIDSNYMPRDSKRSSTRD